MQHWRAFLLANVKEHATLSAGARVDHGVKVETTGEHVNRAADRGCCVSSCSLLHFLMGIPFSENRLLIKAQTSGVTCSAGKVSAPWPRGNSNNR